MLSEDLKKNIKKLAEIIKEIGEFNIFTGAGISTESGIPDFRGPEGIWKKYKPVMLNEFLGNPSARAEYWRRKIALYPALKEAEPNEGHIALAKMFEKGFLKYVITQNIDGLHQKSGIPDDNVIELHGSNAYISCLSCGKRYEWEDVLPLFDNGIEAPICEECEGWLKPATISFGQSMPQLETAKALMVAKNSKILAAIGSSLQVYPAASIPGITKQAGGFLVIINNTPTVQDNLTDIILQGNAGEILKEITKFI
jgi:NAD-dependent deacetylase